MSPARTPPSHVDQFTYPTCPARFFEPLLTGRVCNAFGAWATCHQGSGLLPLGGIAHDHAIAFTTGPGVPGDDRHPNRDNDLIKCPM